MYNRIVTNVSDMPGPRQSGKTAPFQGLGGPYNLRQISPKEAGKTAPQRGMHTPYGLRQLVQGHVVPTTSSTTGTCTSTKSANRTANMATKSANRTANTATKSASTSRGGQCEQPSHVHGVRLGLMKGRKKSMAGKRLVMADRKGHA